MYQDIGFSDFTDAFHRMGRDQQFSYNGLRALYDYLTNLEEETGEDIELDVIALCCDYTEYANMQELKENYNGIESMDDLEEHTTVIPFMGESFIIQNY